MGDRALVIFTDGNEVSPTCYLHWGGDACPALLEEHKALMATRKGDVPYAAARFLGIAHARNPDNNLSLGVWNTEKRIQEAVKLREASALSEHSHGDAGVIVVDVNTYEWQAFGGYLKNSKEATTA